MKSCHRWVLAAGLAPAMSACLSAPSSAQKGEVAGLSAKIAELGSAGKYAEAIPLAQGQLENLDNVPTMLMSRARCRKRSVASGSTCGW